MIILDMVDFDVLLGMNWISPYHAKNVTLVILGVPWLEWSGTRSSYPKKVISFL